MKKTILLAMMMVMTISANAMRYGKAKSEALFLSDKMAYELNLTNEQYEAVYEINLDYLLSVDSRADIFGTWWDRRNADLRFVLSPWQYDKYAALHHFYRPISWHRGWVFHIYDHYDKSRYFHRRPVVYASYRGGHNRVHGSHYAHMRAGKLTPFSHPRHGAMPDKGGKGIHGKGHHPADRHPIAADGHGGRHSRFSHR